MANFDGSIAQVNVQFPIETVIEPVSGENYTKALIFIPLGKAEEYLPTTESPAAGQKIELDSSNYGKLTGGLLKTWLVPFFTSAQAAKIAVAIYDVDAEEVTAKAPLNKVYEAYKYYAYFKFGLAPSNDYNALQTQLAQFCKADPLYSQLWVGTSDPQVLTKESSLVSALKGVAADARVVYNPDGTINAALAQLGATLAQSNATGTPVGNDIDMLAFNTIGASGADDADGNPTNLDATQKATLDEQKIGYNTYVGDGTENVVTEGSQTLQGNVAGAQWVKSYIEYMCKIRTANLITKRNKFRNNDQYQAILLILSDVVKDFLNFGRLADFKITAPVFSDLAKSADAIVVPNAWEATYIDKLRSVTVYGTLYVTQPSK
ncbi:hypothetical protein [uncultured Treponema sp.]|uniref:hypothetical protein n=1 Tax=uncultured Treponema sp. TaxID=162155 RepID=UPI0025998708|nr:hypothetical protein [uncultured Treponema sp.]